MVPPEGSTEGELSSDLLVALRGLPARGAIATSVVDALPMPVLVSRISDDTIVHVNPEFTWSYGYESPQVQGVPSSRLHVEEDSRRRTLESHVDGNLESQEVQLKDAAGEARWAKADVSRFMLDDREDVLLTTFYDIGALKEAEAKARQQDALVADMARFPEMNPGPVARLDMDGTVRLANSAARAVFGPSLEGRNFFEVCPQLFDTAQACALSGGEPLQQDVAVGDAWYRFTVMHVPDSAQLFVYGTEITSQKVAERALAELARFPDMNPGPVCRLDRDGVVLLANPAALRVFECDDLKGRAWRDLVPQVSDDFWTTLIESGESAALEAKIGKRQYVLTHTAEPEGLFVFVYGADVTREREAELALRRSEKMATLGTLAAGVAHELNNPAAAAQRAAEQLDRSFAALQSTRVSLAEVLDVREVDRILAELDARAREAASCPCDLDPLSRSDREAEVEEWLDERGAEAPWETAPALVEGGFDVSELEALADELGPEGAALVATWHAHSYRVYRLLEEIRQGTARLSEIVGAMKAYSYVGQAPIQSVDVNEGIRNTLVILRSKLKKGIVVKQELEPGLPRIEAYGGELNQVWTNLLDNAADAMDGRGVISLRTALVGGNVLVEVEDNGPGIPREAQSRVFDAFFTTKPPGKGTGLGLNTSYSIVVEKHGGSMRLESEPGRTVFSVELPVQQSIAYTQELT